MATTGEFIFKYFSTLAASGAFNSDIAEEMREQRNTSTHSENDILITMTKLDFFTDLTTMFQISVQTVLIVLSESLVIEQTVRRLNIKLSVLREVILYISVCNFAIWCTDSFLDGHLLTKTTAFHLIFGENRWQSVKRSTYPLVLFYRFHSLQMLIKQITTMFKPS